MQIITQTAANVLTVKIDGISTGWEQWVLLRSDAHHDSPFCDRITEKRHLDKALERNAIILDAGDLFDAMQGRFDPRRSMDEVRPEDAALDYYDRVVEHAAEFYAPYAKQWLLFGRGNHESAVLKNTNHCLTSALVGKLREAGCPGVIGGYGGWVRFVFTVHKTKIQSCRIKYFHGAGSDAPVTRGTIQTNRQQVYLPDADIVWNGHSHNAFIVPIARERISEAGKIWKDICYHLRTPGYKDDYQEGAGGWLVERGGPPKPRGACWLRMFYDSAGQSHFVTVEPVLEVI
jgi:predicted phosphodiesterase